jgi:hypothetical protein
VARLPQTETLALGYFAYVLLPSIVLVAPPAFFAILVTAIFVRVFVPRLRMRIGSWILLGVLITTVVIYFWGNAIMLWADHNEYIDFL